MKKLYLAIRDLLVDVPSAELLTQLKSLSMEHGISSGDTELLYAYLSKERNAEQDVTTVPNWATWTPAEAQTWGDANIGVPLNNARKNLSTISALNLTTFKATMTVILNILDSMWTMQQALARLLIALRDKNWPNLS